MPSLLQRWRQAADTGLYWGEAAWALLLQYMQLCKNLRRFCSTLKKASSSVVICLMRQVKGLVLVRLPTAWEERKLRKPQLEAAAKALQMKYATWSTFPGLKISLNFLLSFCNSKSFSRHKSFQPQGLRKYHRSFLAGWLK